MAPPRPCSERAAIRIGAFGASAHPAEASVMSASAIVKSRRLPRRSPSASAAMMPVANAIP
jgi:hypothetical protein